MSHSKLGFIMVASLVLAACDATDPLPTSPDARQNESEGRGFVNRIGATGTSITQGYCSDGLTAACQNTSYYAQLVRMMHGQPSLPLISGTGCKAPLAAPLITFKRISGESVALPEASLSCAPNEPGVVLPTWNVAISGAQTQQALVTRPEDKTDPFGHALYSRILPAGLSQVAALLSLNPKFVVIELGANDILGVHSGAVTPGVSYVPFSVWSGQYNAVLDQLGTVTNQGLLLGLGRDISKLPSLRRGYELWADRAAFLSAFHVEVNANCDGNQNLLVVPILIPTAVAQGLGRRAAGAPPFDLSCAAGPDNTQDRVLTPAEASVADAQFAEMTDHIRAQATLRGYAFVELEVLYGLPKAAFSVVNLMTTATPYGPNISLDGLHPSAAGHTIIAQAALRAIDDKYDIGFDGGVFGISTSPSIRNP